MIPRTAIVTGFCVIVRRFAALGVSFAVLGGVWLATHAAAPSPDTAALLPIGAARIDITPEYPIRLSGYGGRTTVSDGIEQRLWAKALAFGHNAEDSTVLITVDNVGLPFEVTDAVYERVNQEHPLPRAHFAICASHTHNGPMLTGVLPNLFSQDLTAEEQATIDRYTRELTDALVKVALEALKNRQPSLLTWGEGQAAFAKNRRTPNGPVDHSLPVLAVWSPEGKVRAVLANYACHCTTLNSNLCGGDWAGYAQEYIEAAFPGSVALISIGCGADANPHPRTGLEFTQRHGREIATEVQRLLGTSLLPLKALPHGQAKDIALPFAPLPTREEWERLAQESGIVGYHARKNLARLDRGETLPTAMPYRVQAWAFGDDLAMVFLSGEVVVDYAKRLKSEYRNLWINAYANDVRGYIPSTRILQEGGYEGGFALKYYDQPSILGLGTEQLIVDTVSQIVPDTFRSPKMVGVPPPTTPEESLAKIHVRPDYKVQLVASEPQIVDPVAIDFGADGSLWVVEMHDYPLGLDNRGLPGGRIKRLRDPDGDGFFQEAELFLDNLPYPTGLLAWGNGVFICAAPDILYAEDTDGDGKADKVEKWFTGFATENYQARVNGLRLGLDGWIYGANGLLGGVIHGAPGTEPVDIRGRDFRFHPITHAFEPVAGLTQQGRVRTDWGDWLGSDNSTFAWHYPIAERYLARNPHVAPPELRVAVAQSSRVYPASETLERFNHPEQANQATGACGGDVYRDIVLSKELYEDYFVNESVHNLTTRLKLQPAGATFTGSRAEGEASSEFFASADNWARPVEVRTGPDGALWVVDMYRYVIEHPRWIPAEYLAKLDVRAGADKGRIYRILPRQGNLRPWRDLTRLTPTELVAAFDTTNGPVRDMIQARLIQLGDTSPAVLEPLRRLATQSTWPATRAQALATLATLNGLTPELVINGLQDPNAGVRRVTLRLSEIFYHNAPEVLATAATLVTDPDPAVRYQLALSLGEASSEISTLALQRLAQDTMGDPWMRAAILSSSRPCAVAVLEAVLTTPATASGRMELINGLITTAAATSEAPALSRVVTLLSTGMTGDVAEEAWRFAAWAEWLRALERRQIDPAPLLAQALAGDAAASLSRLWETATTLAFDKTQPLPLRQAALALSALRGTLSPADLTRLAEWFEAGAEEALRPAALNILRRQPAEALTSILLRDWARRSPAARSAFVEVLLERDDTLLALLAALENGSVSAAEIPVPRRARFLEHREADIRTRAEKIFAAFQPRQRAEVLAAYRGVTNLKGDEKKGREVFQNVCAICHHFRGVGHELGPDLAAFRNKGVPEFLEAILNPNGIIEPRFLTYVVELKDGRTLSGLVSNETSTSLTLRQPAGLQETIARADIKHMAASPVSLMPEGLEHAISPSAMADLIAFLKGGVPRPFGKATPESAAAALKVFGPEVARGLARITDAAELFDYVSWLGTRPFAHCRQTDGQQKLVWLTQPAPDAIEPQRMYDFPFPGGLGFLSQPEGHFTFSVNGEPAFTFGVVLSEHEWSNADGSVRLRYEPKEAGQQDSNGIFTLSVRGDKLTSGQPLTLQVVGSAHQSQRWFGIYAYSADQLQLRDAVSDLPLARQIIAPQTPNSRRIEIIQRHPERAAEFIQDMVSDLTPGTPEEYRRIPWIWHVAIAAGRRNDAEEVKRLLTLALPQEGQPLRDWECVVIGGGLINGVSQQGVWPHERFGELLQGDEALTRRWQHALEDAYRMADNEKVPTGTRYDALRMTPLLPWERAREQLARYLGKEIHPELQQGAVSGLADAPHPEAAQLLIQHFAGFTDGNKNFALEALLRSPERIKALLDALADGKIPLQALTEEHRRRLLEHADPSLRQRAQALLTAP